MANLPLFRLDIGALAARSGRRAEPHTHRNWRTMHACKVQTGEPCVSFFMIRMTSGTARGRVQRKYVHIILTNGVALTWWHAPKKLDPVNIKVNYNLHLTAVKRRYPLTNIT